MKQMTLLFLLKQDSKEVLLAMKKRGFGEGKWNGVGGKVQEGETIEQAVIREANEEIAVVVEEKDLIRKDEIIFSFDKADDVPLQVHVFVTHAWSGEPTESEEMRPEWYSFDTVPYKEMWIDDEYWLPQMLAGKSIQASFHFNEDGSMLLSKEIETR